ncbi:fimbrial protein [Rahnella selenatireducens]|uniref:fimbrial protein n=1 Tax=Rahnella selenatireducens TaxID=3389797 RepID=UPI0039682933
MANKYIVSLCLSLLSASTSPVYALSDASLNISANIVASPCIVNNSTIDGKVALGRFFTNQLRNPGDATQWVSFSLELNSCPQQTTKVVVDFKGEPYPTRENLFSNSGGSTQVAIEVADVQGGAISNESTREIKVDALHNAILPLKSRMVTPEGNATSGSVSGTIEVSFAYQ